MARKPVRVIQLRINDSVEPVVGSTIDVENGMEVPVDHASRLVIYVLNAGSSHGAVIVRDGDRLTATHSGSGDLTFQVPPLQGRFLGPLDPRRFEQMNNVIWLDFTGEIAGSVTAHRVPIT